MKNRDQALKVFHTLEVFKRREYKLVKESVGTFGITIGTVMITSAIMPDALALIPVAAIGLPATVLSFKKAMEADKVATHADKIFSENSEVIMNFRLHGMEEQKAFKNDYPSLSKKFKPVIKSR